MANRLFCIGEQRFNIFACLLSNPSKNKEFIQRISQFQARSKNFKSQNLQIRDREYKIQNLNYKQDSRLTKRLDLTAKESKIHLQHPNLH